MTTHTDKVHGEREANRLVRLNRALAVLGACTEAVVRATDESALLEEICGIIVNVSGYRMAWIGWAEADENRSVRPVAQAGFEAGYLQRADVRWSDTLRGRGPIGSAIRTGRACVFRDILDPAFAPWREEAARRGYASVVALPLRAGEAVLGALNIYAEAPDAFDAEEVRLLERLAENLMHGVTSLRADAQRRAAEARLRQTTEELRALYAASPDMIFLHAADGHIVDVNESTLRHYGRTLQQMRETTPQVSIGGGHSAEEAFAYIARALAGEDLDFEWVARGDGGEFPVEVRLRRLEYEPCDPDDPEAPKVLAVVRDLTEHKRAEEERLRAQKLESLGLLAGGIAHDFNNLLTGILGHVSLAALHAERPDEVRLLLGEAEKACLRAQELTRQLLTFAKGGTPQRRPVDLRREAQAAARFALRGSGMRLVANFPDDLWPVEADPSQVAQAVQNLVINADQACAGDGTLWLEGENVTLAGGGGLPLTSGRYVRLSVSDDGPGIPEEHRQHVFDPYFTTKKGGSGLGLATTFSIMKAHGGHASVKVPQGGGTRFDLFFPASEAAPQPEKESAPEVDDVRGRILIMDDDPLVRGAARSILVSAGHHVQAVDSGEQALSAYEAAAAAGRPFDLVLLDLTVPGGPGGAEVLDRMRAAHGEVPAIVCSGYSDAPVIANWRSYGFAGAVTKPYRARDLTAEVARVLAARRGA